MPRICGTAAVAEHQHLVAPGCGPADGGDAQNI
jgi:hypothetical protein